MLELEITLVCLFTRLSDQSLPPTPPLSPRHPPLVLSTSTCLLPFSLSFFFCLICFFFFCFLLLFLSSGFLLSSAPTPPCPSSCALISQCHCSLGVFIFFTPKISRCVFIRCRCSADLLLVVAVVDDITHIAFISLNWATAVRARVCVCGFRIGFAKLCLGIGSSCSECMAISRTHFPPLCVCFFPRSSVHMCVLSVMLCEVK